MQRNVLAFTQVHPSLHDKITSFHQETLNEVRTAVDTHDVVIVGMSQNPFPGRARKLLDSKSIAYHYLAYGSYLSGWRDRLPLKMWTGWPTFPMIFVKGLFIGGYTDLERLLASGELETLLRAPRQS
jgi:monothiol glutaredoxin